MSLHVSSKTTVAAAACLPNVSRTYTFASQLAQNELNECRKRQHEINT